MRDLQALLDELDDLSPTERDAVLRHFSATPADLPAGNIIAADVSLEDYMERYAADHCEWVEGYVIKMSPAEIVHNNLVYYLYQLLSAYFELNPIGRVIGQPFVMRLPVFPRRRREPDLLVVLNANLARVKATYLDGPADICIEVVSEESTDRDHGEKFREYEKGGVPEYWILDPLRKETRFYRLNMDGRYLRQNEDTRGYYRTTALPKFALHIPTLWEVNLPGPGAVAAAVKAMLEDEK